MLLALAFTASMVQLPPKPPELPREFRGVWVATVDNIDWPSKRTLSTGEQQHEMVRLLDKAALLHFNAIILQVRPSADALYDSKIEPWSEFLTGRQGKRPSPSYDPLELWVKEAHKRGLELHAWFNPYRALHPAQKGPVASNDICKTNPEVVKKYGPFLWMDPGEPLVQARTLDVILDVVKRYDIDGVHIDDYFYPYREKDPKTGEYIDFPDNASWGRYLNDGGTLNRGDWRRRNVDQFIERLYKAIKKEKRWVKFGISPFGIYRPGVPETIKANVDQYADLYADALKWFREGWCDYFAPQLYWKISQTPQAFPTLLEWWAANNPSGRHLWPGLYTSRLFDGSPTWPASEIVDQIRLTRHTPGAEGTIQFSMVAMLHDSGGIDQALSKAFATPAFVPASPWLGDRAPSPLNIEISPQDTVLWRSTPTRFATSALINGAWTAWTPCESTSMKVPAGADWVAVIAIDRAGQASPPAEIKVRAKAVIRSEHASPLPDGVFLRNCRNTKRLQAESPLERRLSYFAVGR